jgi:hypothetical protein
VTTASRSARAGDGVKKSVPMETSKPSATAVVKRLDRFIKHLISRQVYHA